MRNPPTTARGRDTRGRIVDAAAQLMAVRGVEGTSLDAVLDAADAGKSQLYHYFRDKQSLVRAVVAFRTETVVDAHVRRLRQVRTWADLRAALDAVVEGQEAQACRVGCPIGTLAGELSDVDDDAREDLLAAYARWEAEIRAALDRIRGAGLLAASADTAALATVTLATIQGALLLSKTARTTDRLRTALDQTYTLLRTHAPAAA